MYAFAFYEAKSRRILIARDPFGIKPLYVSILPRSLVFASEVRAVLASGLVPTDLDPAGIASFFAYGAPQDPLTVHQAVKSFPSGSCQWIDASVTQGRQPPSPRRYWRFPEAVGLYPEAEAVWRIADDLQQSVRDQCVADVPLGVFLSGGIDSATIAALACNHTPAIHTFAVGFEGSGAFDETEQAASTAKALGTSHRQTILDEAWIKLQWPEWLKAADRPSIDGLNTFVVSGAVKSQGITVALSGLGADELFGGYPHFRLIPKMQRWLSPLACMPTQLRRSVAGLALSRARRGKRDRLMDVVAVKPDALGIALSIRRLLCNRELQLLGFPNRLPGLTASHLPEQAFSAVGAAGGDIFRTISQVECHFYMGNTLLRDSDCYSMAHSLELRVPFLGRCFSEQVMSLPGGMQDPPGSLNKHLLRRVGHDLLPGEVFDRPKTGFTLPVGDWMNGPLLDDCEAAVRSLAACPLMDARGVHQLWEDYRANWSSTFWTRPLSLVVLGSYLATMNVGHEALPPTSGASRVHIL
jgi:asparagine synthase (glutamine-hydrolysing)